MEMIKALFSGLANPPPTEPDSDALNNRLLDAAWAGQTETVEALIAHGAEVDARDIEGITPLYLAATHGQTEMVEALIASGADVNVHNDLGWTPLHRAGANGETETVKTLIASGADVNARDNEGNTALRWATMFSMTDTAAAHSQSGQPGACTACTSVESPLRTRGRPLS